MPHLLVAGRQRRNLGTSAHDVIHLTFFGGILSKALWDKSIARRLSAVIQSGTIRATVNRRYQGDAALTSTNETATMYEKPLLQKFGTVRELTRLGFSGAGDGAIFVGTDDTGDAGCELWGCPTRS